MIATFPWPVRELPTLMTAGRFPLDDDAFRTTYLSARTHALHLHDYHGTIRLGRRTLALSPGVLTLTPLRVPSAYALPRGGHHWCVHFRPAKARGAVAGLPLHAPLGVQAPFATERLRRISGLFERGRQGDLLAMTSASLLLQELLLWVADVHREAAPVAGRLDVAMEKLVSILQARFTENLSVPALADELGMSQNYLARRFRERFKTTIPHYLVARRVEHACYLLASTDMPIHRVGQRVGMADPQHFNKQFRRVVGRSPSAYRLGTSNQHAAGVSTIVT